MDNSSSEFEIFLVTAPGLEDALCEEAVDRGFAVPARVKGGVTIKGGWPEVWRANLEMRGASRVLARIGSFRAMHLAQLDKRARKLAWGAVLRPDQPVRVEASSKGSRIYHAGAAAERIERAIFEEFGAPISPEAEICIKARIDDDLCTISVDTSGELLHKRAHKEAVNKAPMRENLAALFLRQCGFDGSQSLVDPMCGSGTFVIEAAEIALGLQPGRSRHFAFERLAGFDEEAWRQLHHHQKRETTLRFHGSDRDEGAIRMSRANAQRAGVDAVTDFQCKAIADLTAPEGPPGLVIVNPPYGERIGERRSLQGLYHSLGLSLRARFLDWRVGIITNEKALAQATGLPFRAPIGPVSHGGIQVTLYQTGPLG